MSDIRRDISGPFISVILWAKLDLAFNNVKPKDRYFVLD